MFFQNIFLELWRERNEAERNTFPLILGKIGTRSEWKERWKGGSGRLDRVRGMVGKEDMIPDIPRLSSPLSPSPRRPQSHCSSAQAFHGSSKTRTIWNSGGIPLFGVCFSTVLSAEPRCPTVPKPWVGGVWTEDDRGRAGWEVELDNAQQVWARWIGGWTAKREVRRIMDVR